jgi:hypothetical protein
MMRSIFARFRTRVRPLRTRSKRHTAIGNFTFERLEARALLASFVVNTDGTAGSAIPGVCDSDPLAPGEQCTFQAALGAAGSSAGSIADIAGNGFDGDGDGATGGDFVQFLSQARSTSRAAVLAAVDEVLSVDQSWREMQDRDVWFGESLGSVTRLKHTGRHTRP